MEKIKTKKSIFTRLRNYFLAGAVVLIPIAITLYLTLFFIKISAPVNVSGSGPLDGNHPATRGAGRFLLASPIRPRRSSHLAGHSGSLATTRCLCRSPNQSN